MINIFNHCIDIVYSLSSIESPFHSFYLWIHQNCLLSISTIMILTLIDSNWIFMIPLYLVYLIKTIFINWLVDCLFDDYISMITYSNVNHWIYSDCHSDWLWWYDYDYIFMILNIIVWWLLHLVTLR